jgi:hypothetical protein
MQNSCSFALKGLHITSPGVKPRVGKPTHKSVRVKMKIMKMKIFRTELYLNSD